MTLNKLLFGGATLLLVIGLGFMSDAALGDAAGQSKLDQLEKAFAYTPPQENAAPEQVKPAPALSEGIIKSKIFNELLEAGLVTLVALAGLVIALRHLRGEQMVQAIGVILVVFGTVFLALVSEVSAQLSAATGVLGSVAGYIFGRSHQREVENPQTVDSSKAGGKTGTSTKGQVNPTSPPAPEPHS